MAFTLVTRITSDPSSIFSTSELRNYASLFRYLSLRDVYVKYKQTWVGLGWSVIRPLINILIFGSLSFLIDRSGNFAERFITVSAGVVIWQLVSTTITEVSNSLTANANLLTKIYFPKILLPLSALLVCLVDFLIAFFLFLIAFIIVRGAPPWQIAFLPVVIAQTLVLCFSIGLLFATGSVRYRDVKFILPFIIQILFYASPVFVTSVFILDLDIPAIARALYLSNPFVFIVNGFRYCFTGTFDAFEWRYAILSVVLTVGLLILSLRLFLGFERSFADYI